MQLLDRLHSLLPLLILGLIVVLAIGWRRGLKIRWFNLMIPAAIAVTLFALWGSVQVRRIRQAPVGMPPDAAQGVDFREKSTLKEINDAPASPSRLHAD